MLKCVKMIAILKNAKKVTTKNCVYYTKKW